MKWCMYVTGHTHKLYSSLPDMSFRPSWRRSEYPSFGIFTLRPELCLLFNLKFKQGLLEMSPEYGLLQGGLFWNSEFGLHYWVCIASVLVRFNEPLKSGCLIPRPGGHWPLWPLHWGWVHATEGSYFFCGVLHWAKHLNYSLHVVRVDVSYEFIWWDLKEIRKQLQPIFSAACWGHPFNFKWYDNKVSSDLCGGHIWGIILKLKNNCMCLKHFL